MKSSEDHFKILRKIQKKPESNQRELAKKLSKTLKTSSIDIKTQHGNNHSESPSTEQ